MAAGFQQMTILGYVGRDPELAVTSDGTPVTKFSIAVTRKVKGEDQTTWYNIVAWRGLAETIEQHVRKGMMLFVQGYAEFRTYVTKDGRQGSSIDVTIDKFSFAGGGNGNKETSATASGKDAFLPADFPEDL